jgi:hypothetical protein
MMKVRSLTARIVLPIALGIWVIVPLTGAEGPASTSTQPAAANDLRDFRFRGQPIHPACVMKLGTELADGLPIVAAVDVEGCTQSQQHPAAFTVRDGWVRIELEGRGWFAYRHLGVSPGGTHVLQTQSSGGGTGIFKDLLLVRFHSDRVRQDGKLRDRLLMTSVGNFTLGDRDDGEVRLEGNVAVIGRSRYRERETTVPLD